MRSLPRQHTNNSHSILQYHVFTSSTHQQQSQYTSVLCLYINILTACVKAITVLPMQLSLLHHHHHLSLNREGRWSTTDNFATSFLHFFHSLLIHMLTLLQYTPVSSPDLIHLLAAALEHLIIVSVTHPLTSNGHRTPSYRLFNSSTY